MIAILKLRLMKMRDDIKLIGIMTAMTLVMIGVFSSIDYTNEVTYIGLVDEDNTTMSQLLAEKLDKQEGYEVISYSLDEAKEAVKNYDVSGAFYLREGFEEQVESGKVEVLKLITSENMSNLQMDTLLSVSINEVNSDQTLINMLNQVVQKDTSTYTRAALKEHRDYKKPIELVSRSLTDARPYDSVKHSVVGFSLFFAMFTIVFGISDILMDKEYHTWDRLLISPISKLSILGGNLLMVFVIGFVQVSSMFIVSKYLFKVDWAGNIFHMLIVVAAFVFCVTALGMFLSNFVNTMGQLSAISPVILTGTAMLGGCFWPLEIVTAKPLLLLSNITPQKWAVSAIEKIMVYGAGFNEVIFSVAVLVAMGMVYMLLGAFFLQKKSA
ncbi:ABC transporter permease [Acidaminobacter sp. JC074]|uniref:ABC transporter permease n=1 Tax=Acidaminobacter sp. JC074 TaxID=2530199 RepID=UPI001F0FAB23|nr:ABC transporter permease [Acidaminobacter sp. JC074]MCH4889893.1 ABC transporter permease [Acidaminobacter sp. JC074]